jgi:hypothetical protein
MMSTTRSTSTGIGLDHSSVDTDVSSSSTSSPTSVTAAQIMQTSFKYPTDSEQPRNISVVENDDEEDVNDDDVVTSSSADIYGENHPIETNEMIRKALRDFDNLLRDHIPSHKKKSVLDAEKNCPELLTDSLKLMFLRCECFKVDVRCNNLIVVWKRMDPLFVFVCSLISLHTRCLRQWNSWQ